MRGWQHCIDSIQSQPPHKISQAMMCNCFRLSPVIFKNLIPRTYDHCCLGPTIQESILLKKLQVLIGVTYREAFASRGGEFQGALPPSVLVLSAHDTPCVVLVQIRGGLCVTGSPTVVCCCSHAFSVYVHAIEDTYDDLGQNQSYAMYHHCLQFWCCISYRKHHWLLNPISCPQH